MWAEKRSKGEATILHIFFSCLSFSFFAWLLAKKQGRLASIFLKKLFPSSNDFLTDVYKLKGQRLKQWHLQSNHALSLHLMRRQWSSCIIRRLFWAIICQKITQPRRNGWILINIQIYQGWIIKQQKTWTDHQELIKKKRSISLPLNLEIAFHSSFCLFFLSMYETEFNVIESERNYHKSQWN